MPRQLQVIVPPGASRCVCKISANARSFDQRFAVLAPRRLRTISLGNSSPPSRWQLCSFPSGKRCGSLAAFVVPARANAIRSWLFFTWHLGGVVAFAEVLLLWLLIACTLAPAFGARPLAGMLLVQPRQAVRLGAAYVLWRLNPAIPGLRSVPGKRSIPTSSTAALCRCWLASGGGAKRFARPSGPAWAPAVSGLQGPVMVSCATSPAVSAWLVWRVPLSAIRRGRRSASSSSPGIKGSLGWRSSRERGAHGSFASSAVPGWWNSLPSGASGVGWPWCLTWRRVVRVR